MQDDKRFVHAKFLAFCIQFYSLIPFLGFFGVRIGAAGSIRFHPGPSGSIYIHNPDGLLGYVKTSCQ